MDEYLEAVTSKDWKRMSDLKLTGKDYSSVVKSLKDKNKTINRFVAGLKLFGNSPKFNKLIGKYIGYFGEFGDKALELGATQEEIEKVFNETEIPDELKLLHPKSNFPEEIQKKKLNNTFVSFISVEIIKNGWDIEFLKHNGNAITPIGREAMERNGRKWTIGYKTIITIEESKIHFNFDAITDEGGGPTYYCVDSRGSDIFFTSEKNRDYMGKREFLNKLILELKKYY